MSIIAKIVLSALTLYAAVALVAWLGQRRLTYFPNTERVAPADEDLEDVEERLLETPDGARLVVWQAKPRPGQPTLLYFHGNGGGLTNRARRFARYQDRGFGLFAMSYRGYSGSSGSPTEAVNLADAKLAYDTLVAEGTAPDDIVLYGESLGSGVAVAVAVEKPVAAVVLDAPYTSIVDIAARRYPWLPVRLLLAERYESDKRIASVHAPILILHGALDHVIPAAMGRRLYELANQPKRYVLFPEGNHTDLDQHGAVDTVREWLARIRADR